MLRRKRSLQPIGILIVISTIGVITATGQPPDQLPSFGLADVRLSNPSQYRYMRGGVIRGDRFEAKTATMLDLVKAAYGVGSDQVVDGPSWLDWDRFDLVGKVPPETSPETAARMLRSLLTDRFHLTLHSEVRVHHEFILQSSAIHH